MEWRLICVFQFDTQAVSDSIDEGKVPDDACDVMDCAIIKARVA